MWGFRAELLHAQSMPLHLLDILKGIFESSDSVVRKAAELHRDQFAKHLEFILKQDYSRLLAEWDSWLELSQNQHRKPQRLDAEKILSLGSQVNAYEETYGLLNGEFFSSVAIGLFSAGSSREEVVSFLDGQSWATKHEIVTRWGWMREHRRLLQEGRSLTAPYSCVVTLKDQDGRQTDEEFYSLLVFLHLLRANHGDELLFAQKGETPDFTLTNKNGDLVGAEITEVWISGDWGEEQDAARIAQKYIFNQLRYQLVRISVRTPHSWRALSNRLPAVGEWLSSELFHIGPIQTELKLKNSDLDLAIKLTPAESPPSGISFVSNSVKGSSDIEKNSLDLHASLRADIERKIVRKGKQRERPSVQPCHLVIYPHHLLDADLERVIQDFFQSPPIAVSSHFEKVWLCDGARLVSLNQP